MGLQSQTSSASSHKEKGMRVQDWHSEASLSNIPQGTSLLLFCLGSGQHGRTQDYFTGKCWESCTLTCLAVTLDRPILICLQSTEFWLHFMSRILCETCIRNQAARAAAHANHTDMSTTAEMGRAILLLNSCSADASSPSEPPLDSGPALLPVRDVY